MRPNAANARGAAHAQHDFLTDTHLQIAAVKLRGNGAVLGVVIGDIGVQQIEVDASNGEFPDLGEHLTARQFDADLERFAVLTVGNFLHGQVVEILVELDGLLDAFAVDLLFEITVAVEQTDGAEVQVEVARALAMVAGEDAQATGVVWHALVETELRGEIGDQVVPFILFPGGLGAQTAVGIRSGHVRLELGVQAAEFAQETFVAGDFFQAGLPGELQDAQRVVVGALPKIVVQRVEQPSRGRFPTPPQVINNLPQRLQGRRQLGDDVEGLDGWLHNYLSQILVSRTAGAGTLASGKRLTSQTHATRLVDG